MFIICSFFDIIDCERSYFFETEESPMKLFLKTLSVLILVLLFVFLTYRLIEFLDYKSSLSNLKKHIFTENEKTIKEFKYDKKNYMISKYYDDPYPWSQLNLLLKDGQTYYILENIKNCSTVDDASNLYLKDNVIYIHCIGKEGIIDKYTIDGLNIEKKLLNFDFKSTPNISQLHIGIDDVDDEYIYLSSPFKVNATIADDPKVKCSFENKICRYY